MKKLMIILITAIVGLSACKTRTNYDGVYVAHIKGEYSIGDDTVVVKDSIISKHTTYQKIRNGQLLPEMHSTKIWTLHSPDAPTIEFENGYLIIGITSYRKLP